MSKVIIKLDKDGNVILPKIVLATRSGKRMGTILSDNNKLTGSLENGFSLTFLVNKYLDGRENNVWNDIDNFKLIHIPDWDIWFEIYVSVSENSSTVKEVNATSICEAELSQILLHNIEINTEIDIQREDYVPTIIYNNENPSASLLDRYLEKAPHYHVEHVDKSIAKLQRTFTADNVSVRDAFHEVAEEINALLILNSSTNSDGQIARGISLYDLEEHCEDCGFRGKSNNGQCPECGSQNWSYGYGEDSGIFISSENLSDDIKLTTNTDKIKNCFKLVAGDDLMTATVAGCCPNGIGYLWYLSDEVRNDMSDDLRNRLDAYDELTKEVEQQCWIINDTAYNALADKYSKSRWDNINGYSNLLNAMYDIIDFKLYLEHDMFPTVSILETNAQEQMSNILRSLSPVSVQNLSVLSSTTATSYVAQAIRSIIDPRYTASTSDEILNGNQWYGTIKLTRTSDETDTFTKQNVKVELNEDYVNYLKTLIDRAINTSKLEELNIIELFDMNISDFQEEIKKYCLSYLQIFYDSSQTCLNVLIERGAGNDSISPEAYNTLYTTYYQKKEALQSEIALRENEISVIDNKQNSISSTINQIHTELDLENFLGETLWLELAAYRREDVYQNDNYISDGLSNAEVFEKAREFIETAKSDIQNSNYGQYEITSSLHNLLLIPEFKKLQSGFALGNWLRIRIDGEIYHLRLIKYSIDFDNIENINVTYSNITKQNLLYDSLIKNNSKYQSMASTYGNVSRQASHGNDSNKQIKSWVTDGLQATLTRFVSDAVNQNMMWDTNGLLFRRYDDILEDYSLEQLRIINSTLAVTDDNWKSVKTAVGGFDYKDPVSGEIKHGYGINAELLIGKLILGENLGLYNEANSLTFDSNGLNVFNDVNSFTVSPNGDTLLSLKQGNNDIFWVDNKGGLHLRPTEFTLTTGQNLEDALSDIKDATEDAQNLQIILTNEYEGVPTDANGNYSGSLSIKTGVIAYYGRVDVTNDCIYTISTSSGVTGNWNLATHEYTITTLSSDSGYVDITASYKSAFTVTKRFNVAKVKAGTNGEDGRGISSVAVSYALSGQGSTPPSSGWQSSMPNLTAGSYLWTRTVTAYTDNSPSTTSYSVGRIGENGVNGNDGIGIKSTEISYQKGDSGTVAPTGAWSATIPIVQPGEYLWTRTRLTYTNNTEDVSYSVGMMGQTGLQGIQGEKGDDGVPGISNYFHIKYSDKEKPETASDMWETPDDYIGTYVDENKIDSTNPADYKWTRFRGLQGEAGEKGIPGDKGADGTTYYLHIKYMSAIHYLKYTLDPNNAEVKLLETPSQYIGQYVDTNEIDSTSPKEYKWSKIEGTDGENARVFFIESSADVVRLQSDGTVSPESITFSLYSRVGNSQDRSPYTNIYMHFYYSTDGENFLGYEHIAPSNTISSMSIQISSLMDSHPNIKAFRFIANDSTDSTVLDMKTIPVIADGKNGQDGAEMTPEEVFNKLTNYGAMEGIFVTQAGENGEPGHVYINGTYIQADTISGDLIKGGTIEGVRINGNTITGGTIDGSVLSSSAGGYHHWNLNNENIADWYTTGITIDGGKITGYTWTGASGQVNDNTAQIMFDSSFTEGSNRYYALRIESSNAICFKSDKLWIYNHTNANNGSDIFDLGQSTQVQIPAMTPFGQGYVTLRFNKGILVSAM